MEASTIRIALAGNPNTGKTTLFNALTGSNQFVGNWPGVTVEKKEGKMKNSKEYKEKKVSIWLAAIPLVTLVAMLAMTIKVYGADALNGGGRKDTRARTGVEDRDGLFPDGVHHIRHPGGGLLLREKTAEADILGL